VLRLRPARTAKSTNKPPTVITSPVSAVQHIEAEQLHPRSAASRITKADVEAYLAVTANRIPE